MKIKTVSNINQVIGGIIGYSLLLLFLFGGFYFKYKSVWILITGITITGFIIFAALRTIRTVIFYSDKIVLYGPLRGQETILLTSNIELNLIGGTYRIPSYSVVLWNNRKKITNFRLDSSEWEFEDFYHNTKEVGYRWKISDDQKAARISDYQLYLERIKVMDLNRK